MNAPDLYYVCRHSAMAGKIYTTGPAGYATNYTYERNAITAQNGDLIYNSSTNKFRICKWNLGRFTLIGVTKCPLIFQIILMEIQLHT